MNDFESLSAMLTQAGIGFSEVHVSQGEKLLDRAIEVPAAAIACASIRAGWTATGRAAGC
jgi:hypothetical protein